MGFVGLCALVVNCVGMTSLSPPDSRSGHLVSRLSALERENVELQEEVLFLKKQIMSLKTAGHSRPSSPVHRESPKRDDDLQESIDRLKVQVVQAVSELRKYRITEASPSVRRLDLSPASNNDQRWSVITEDTKSVRSELQSSLPDIPQSKGAEEDFDDFDKLLDTDIKKDIAGNPGSTSVVHTNRPHFFVNHVQPVHTNPTHPTGSKPISKSTPVAVPATEVDDFFDDLLS